MGLQELGSDGSRRGDNYVDESQPEVHEWAVGTSKGRHGLMGFGTQVG